MTINVTLFLPTRWRTKPRVQAVQSDIWFSCQTSMSSDRTQFWRNGGDLQMSSLFYRWVGGSDLFISQLLPWFIHAHFPMMSFAPDGDFGSACVRILDLCSLVVLIRNYLKSQMWKRIWHLSTWTAFQLHLSRNVFLNHTYQGGIQRPCLLSRR